MNDLAVSSDAQAPVLVPRKSLKLPYPFVAPANALEKKICAAFSGALRVEPVGLDDEFYDLGGDSLMGEQLSIEIEAASGQPFAISKLFEFGTPRRIAQLLGDAPVAQTDTGTIFLVHGRGGYTAPRPVFRNAITSGRRLHTFELPGIRGDGPRFRHLSDLARAYVRQIEEIQPTGPVHLAAFCVGSLIALEMAAQLRASGREIEQVVLIDPRLPHRINRRFKAEKELAASRPGLVSATRYFMATGRLPGSAFLEPFLTAFEFRWAVQVEMRRIERDRRNGVSFAKRHEGVGLKDEPRAALITCYKFSWPPPFQGTAYILASSDRAQTFSDPNKAWGWLAPKRVVEVASEKHNQLGSAAGDIVARRMDEILA